jgi:hypothetical protein
MSTIRYATKEENNRRREEEFLALEPGERFELFLKMCSAMSGFAQDRPQEDKGNFIVDKLRKDGV